MYCAITPVMYNGATTITSAHGRKIAKDIISRASAGLKSVFFLSVTRRRSLTRKYPPFP